MFLKLLKALLRRDPAPLPPESTRPAQSGRHADRPPVLARFVRREFASPRGGDERLAGPALTLAEDEGRGYDPYNTARPVAKPLATVSARSGAR